MAIFMDFPEQNGEIPRGYSVETRIRYTESLLVVLVNILDYTLYSYLPVNVDGSPDIQISLSLSRFEESNLEVVDVFFPLIDRGLCLSLSQQVPSGKRLHSYMENHHF